MKMFKKETVRKNLKLIAIALMAMFVISACNSDDNAERPYSYVFDTVNNPYYQNWLIGKWEHIANVSEIKGRTPYKYSAKHPPFQYIEFMKDGKWGSDMIAPGYGDYKASKDLLMFYPNNADYVFKRGMRFQNWEQSDTLILEFNYKIYLDTSQGYSNQIFRRAK